MLDGTIKQINPFTGTEVWTVPGRGLRPLQNVSKEASNPIEAKSDTKEDYCDFCYKNYFNTPPEKSRVILDNSIYKMLHNVSADDIHKTYALFRRVPNLFEIVTYDYWTKNFNYKLNDYQSNWKKTYLSSYTGKEHVLKIINQKLKSSGYDPGNIDNDEKLDKYADAFFGGCHDVIIAGRHYKKDSKTDKDLCGPGDLSEDLHYQYIRFTIEAMKDIYTNNRFVRYVSVFQNWLAPAGASFDHLHKQLVGIDEWGTSIEREVELVRKNKNIYNEWGANFAAYNDFVFLENDYGLCFADIGHRYPTIAIFSKSINARPYEHTSEEIKGISDLIRACYLAMGNELSCNEEWYYTPNDTIYHMPWHILIKWRINIPAGFEGGTKVYVNPISPIDIRDRMVPKLYKLRDKGLIKGVRIAEECKIVHNPLLYYKSVLF